jgi:hypothetical protein
VHICLPAKDVLPLILFPRRGFIVATLSSKTKPSTNIEEPTKNTKTQIKQDAEDLANLIYGIFKARQLNANVDHDQNSKSYTTEEA